VDFPRKSGQCGTQSDLPGRKTATKLPPEFTLRIHLFTEALRVFRAWTTRQKNGPFKKLEDFLNVVVVAMSIVEFASSCRWSVSQDRLRAP
jgi:hypothetical protein